MKKILKKIFIIMSCLALFTGVFWGMKPAEAEAVCSVIVRVPLDGSLYNHGVRVPDTALSNAGVLNGRIHQIACQTTGVVYSYKEYAIYDFEDFAQLAAFDGANRPMEISLCKPGFINYTGATPAVTKSVENVVAAAAVAYHERVSGRMKDPEFGKYFQVGSIAYNNAVASDNCRKWHAFYNNGTIKNTFVWDVYFYSPVDFVAKVAVSAGPYFADTYTISMLFHNAGAGYRVTYFTYME